MTNLELLAALGRGLEPGEFGQLHGFAELLESELPLRVLRHQVLLRLADAKERHVDVVVDQRLDEVRSLPKAASSTFIF